LGEAQSKCAHISGVPLRPEVAENLNRTYLAKGALATNAIEGNTLTEAQALARVEGRRELPPSQEYLGVEIDNLVRAIGAVRDRVLDGDGGRLSADTLRAMHAEILRGLKLAPEVEPGRFRQHSVTVGRYLAPSWQDVPGLVDRLCAWLDDHVFGTLPGHELALRILKAIVAHLYIAWVHPFADGNGRTARLAEVQLLLAAGVPSLAAQLLSNHYNQTRTEYYRQFDAASRSGGDPLPFITYAIEGFVDGLRGQLALIREQQWEDAWRNYVHDRFQALDRPADIRRRHLVLALTDAKRPISPSEVRRLSPRMAEAYAGLTSRTIIRDLWDAVAMGLLRDSKDGFVANREAILQFLPRTKDGPSESGRA